MERPTGRAGGVFEMLVQLSSEDPRRVSTEDNRSTIRSLWEPETYGNSINFDLSSSLESMEADERENRARENEGREEIGEEEKGREKLKVEREKPAEIVAIGGLGAITLHKNKI
ncbi:virulence factors putative positive transcription regulator BvgA [Striga asiatica]|uniref:Virulence factors putative positive transcription regulator BvgA n=1 Tax=Striga asiatica TaxID=4170 RepID=A0A5A7PDX2_STRAF|nr:virulence factors putative positive transcription regulator BvgA [Striga asiatica]